MFLTRQDLAIGAEAPEMVRPNPPGTYHLVSKESDLLVLAPGDVWVKTGKVQVYRPGTKYEEVLTQYVVRRLSDVQKEAETGVAPTPPSFVSPKKGFPVGLAVGATILVGLGFAGYVLFRNE